MERNVLELLEKSAVEYANKVAVREPENECTFAQLCVDSKAIGTFLISKEIKGKTIPVVAEKSILTLKSFFGIVYAGGSYSLINVSQPKDRVERILHLLDAPIVITTREYWERVSETDYDGEIICIDELSEQRIDEEELAKIRRMSLDTDPLYVNFTSGSTGTPKGVVVGHQSVLEFIHDFTNLFGFSSKDIIGNQAPFDFDVSVKDIYSMLMTGATMYIIPKEYFAFPKKILDVLEEQNITTLTWAVSALCMITSLKGFSYKIPSCVNKVIFSGEVMPLSHLREWRNVLPNAVFVNVYGPTEITCNCTYYFVTGKCFEEKVLPIGIPFPNEKVFLLDEENNKVEEPGKEGEICVGGSCLALGYYADTEKTQKSFVQNPLNGSFRETIYRTGDIGCYREDGNLLYRGRKDFQIKHLGHRIELNEIEFFLEQVEGIDRACCLHDEQRQQIVAVYQGNAEKSTIKGELRKKMIKYMIPDRYIQVEKMPMNSNGKIDRKRLRNDYLGD